MRYASEPLISGYVSPENLAALAGSAVVTAVRRGEGVVIRIVDDPAFRGIWYGTEKLLANALFFGPAIKSTAALSRFGVREDAGARPAAAEGQH